MIPLSKRQLAELKKLFEDRYIDLIGTDLDEAITCQDVVRVIDMTEKLIDEVKELKDEAAYIQFELEDALSDAHYFESKYEDCMAGYIEPKRDMSHLLADKLQRKDQ